MTIEAAAATREALPTIELGLPGWTLRAWRRGDAPALSRHAGNVEIWRWMSDAFPHPYTLEIAEHWIARGHVDFGGDHWAIACGDEAVGGCGLAAQQGAMRVAEKSGFVLEGVQRQGAVKAGQVIDRWVFARYREASSEA